MKYFKSNLHSFILGLTWMVLALFDVMLFVIKPLWTDIDKFISQAAGFRFQWVLTVFLIVLFIFEFFFITFFTRLTKEKTGRHIAGLAVMFVFSSILIFLFSQIRLSLFSIISVSWFYWTFEAFFIGCSILLASGILIVGLTRGAVFYSKGAALSLTAISVVLAIFFISMTASANREEATRWPVVEKAPHPGFNAQWIVPDIKKSMSGANLWICYRKSFEIADVPKHLNAGIAADSKYWLWINGKQVVAEGGLKRGPNPYDTYYDVVDVAPYLKKGENLIAVLIWHFGKNAFSHRDSGLAGFIFNAASPGISLITDSSWKAMIHPAYLTAGRPDPNFRLAESNVLFDANRDIPGWTAPGFDDSSFKAVRLMGKPPAGPWNNLVPRPIPMWKDYGLKDYINPHVFPFPSDGGNIVCSLPYNAQIKPYFKINAAKDLLVDIRTDDYQGGGEYNIRTYYTTREGDQEFECPAWMNGHKVIYAFPIGVKVLSLKYRETGYNTAFDGNFECSDPFFNRLWRKSRRTLYVNMRDSYMDCPDRERAQWWGDASLEIGESFYALSPASHLLGKKAILELCAWQRKDDVLYSPVPSGNWNIELAQQSLAAVGWFGFWNYYMHTGDKKTLVNAYPAAKKYIGLWQTNEEGLPVHRNTRWEWADWGEHADAGLLETEWYYLALKGLRATARMAGNDGDAVAYEKKMRLIKEVFRKNYWDTGARAFRSKDYKGETDERVNAMAVVAGLADETDYPAVENVISTGFHASPYMEKYVIEALFMMGRENEAFARMKKRYLKMAESPYTTLWEGWEIGSDEYGGGTYNHAWSGGMLTLLSSYAAGVRPTRPGYEEYEVMPQPGPFSSVKCTVPSVKGRIEVDIKKDAGTFNLTVNSPAGTTGIIGIPDEFSGGIRITDESSKASEGTGTSRITRLGAGAGYLRFAVAPGKYSFSATKK